MSTVSHVILVGSTLNVHLKSGTVEFAYPTSVGYWLGGGGGVTPPSSGFVWPFSLNDANINNGYPEDGFETPGRPSHQGIDFAFGNATNGANMPASAAGEIHISGDYYGYGNAIVIDHGEHDGVNVKTLYGHMQDGSLTLGVGDPVAQGQTLGLVGNTGNSFGAHLHYEVWLDDTKVDPLIFMASANPTNAYWGM